MKLRNHPFYVEPAKPRIFEESEYEHPWYKHAKEPQKLNKPNPPTEAQVKKANLKTKRISGRRNNDHL